MREKFAKVLLESVHVGAERLYPAPFECLVDEFLFVAAHVSHAEKYASCAHLYISFDAQKYEKSENIR